MSVKGEKNSQLHSSQIWLFLLSGSHLLSTWAMEEDVGHRTAEEIEHP